MSILTRSSPAVRARSCGQSPPLWQVEMQAAIRTCGELCRALDLPVAHCDGISAAAESFPVFAPRPYLSRITPGDPRDPLLLQVLPRGAENAAVPQFTFDPVGDAAALAAPGMLQKYAGRALLMVAADCAVHCRYCFRRHFEYELIPRGAEAWIPALQAIAADRSIEEVILSGGDPLTLADRRLAALAEQMAAIPHVRRLRIHTRLPIVIPSRVDDRLLKWIASSRLTPILVIHANHAQEVDDEVARAIARLRAADVMLFNQSVLLRGVNDSAEALAALSQRLIEIGVAPYYLHQLDRVAGAAHFEVSEQRGRALLDELRRRLPGYMVPKYVREVRGEASKIPL